jgi:hypothetical protein
MDETNPTPEEKPQEQPEAVEEKAAAEEKPAPEEKPADDEAPAAEESPADIPLPPPSFEFLVLSLRSQAEMQLGLLHFGEEKDRPQPNFPLARHSIDMLGMIQEKTKGNLSMEESRLLENSLTELRYRFVQVAEGGKQE